MLQRRSKGKKKGNSSTSEEYPFQYSTQVIKNKSSTSVHTHHFLWEFLKMSDTGLFRFQSTLSSHLTLHKPSVNCWFRGIQFAVWQSHGYKTTNILCPAIPAVWAALQKVQRKVTLLLFWFYYFSLKYRLTKMFWIFLMIFTNTIDCVQGKKLFALAQTF